MLTRHARPSLAGEEPLSADSVQGHAGNEAAAWGRRAPRSSPSLLSCCRAHVSVRPPPGWDAWAATCPARTIVRAGRDGEAVECVRGEPRGDGCVSERRSCREHRPASKNATFFFAFPSVSGPNGGVFGVQSAYFGAARSFSGRSAGNVTCRPSYVRKRVN